MKAIMLLGGTSKIIRQKALNHVAHTKRAQTTIQTKQ